MRDKKERRFHQGDAISVLIDDVTLGRLEAFPLDIIYVPEDVLLLHLVCGEVVKGDWIVIDERRWQIHVVAERIAIKDGWITDIPLYENRRKEYGYSNKNGGSE